MQSSSKDMGRVFRSRKVALLSICILWVWSTYKNTIGMRGAGYENLFLTKTYAWICYSILSLICFGLFLFLVKHESSRLKVATGILICTVTLILQVMSPVGLSTDYYRYIWQGRLSNAGQDNYVLTPWNAGVEKANIELFPRMDWRSVSSVYPPLAEQYFRIPAKIFDAKVIDKTNFQTRLSYSKIPNLLLFLLCGFLLYKITNRKLIAFGWLTLPFLQYELVNAAHIDVLSVALLLGSFYAIKLQRPVSHILAGSLIAAAGMVKLAPFVIIVPVAAYLYVNNTLRSSLAAIGGFLVVTFAGVSPYTVNDFALAKRTAYWFSGDEFSLGNPFYELTSLVSSDYGPVVLKVIVVIASVLLLVHIARSVKRKKLSYTTMLMYCVLLLLIPFIAAPIVLPWYWVAPIAIVALLLGQKDRIITKSKVLIILFCVVLLLIQYVDRAITASLETRQVVPVLASFLMYIIIIGSLSKIYLRDRNELKLESQ